MERIDQDENAETGDTRIRVVENEGDGYEIRREEYSLREFVTDTEVQEGGVAEEEYEDRDEGFEWYDWAKSESIRLYNERQAEQVASMLEKQDAFDANVLFFRQINPDSVIEEDPPVTGNDTLESLAAKWEKDAEDMREMGFVQRAEEKGKSAEDLRSAMTFGEITAKKSK